MNYLSTLYVCDSSGDGEDGLPGWITHWECLHECPAGDPAEAVHRVVTAFAHSAEGRALRSPGNDDTISYEEVLPAIPMAAWVAEGVLVSRRLTAPGAAEGSAVLLNGSWDLIPHGDEECGCLEGAGTDGNL